ncbi:MAG: hypothetical protein P1V29_07780, partial [Gammaproteobacteria bacterium]|nr:hypothetical protein [Gammaproteobacteria bacterium]
MLMINTRTTSSLLHRLLTQYLSLASTVLVLFALATASLSVRAAESPRVGDFALLDAEGYFHHMSWYDDHRALVFL